MIVEVRLFAAARLLGKADSVSLELPDHAPVGLLRERLSESHPNLAKLLVTSRIAVNSEYMDDQHKIPPGAEVAIIPPVSGGSVG